LGLGEVYHDREDQGADGCMNRTPFSFPAFKAKEHTKLGG
jgi:hypothetical protein